MFALDQALVGRYHSQALRAEARRDAVARTVAPHTFKALLRRLGR